MDEMPFISVIIPAWNDEKVIDATLDALKNVDYPKERCEIIVIAGGSDNTYGVAEKYSEIMRDFSMYFLLKQEPRGKNAALQKGLEERNKKSDFIVLLDADTMVEKDWLKKAVATITTKKISVMTGDLYPIRGINYISAFYLYEKMKSKCIDNRHALSGGCIILKREVLENEDISDLFDENIFVGVDYHLTNKLVEKKYEIGFAERAIVYTYLPTALGEFVEAENRWIKAWLKISSSKKWFNIRILKNFAVVFSPIILFIVYLLGAPIYLYLAGIPFIMFSIKTIRSGIQVYNYERNKRYIYYLWAYLLLSFLLEILITVLFLKMKLFGLKQEKHFKGPRP